MNNLTRIMILLSTLSIGDPASACADGPDTYRVTGVASDDVLNVRSGPGVEFSIVGELRPDAIEVENLDSVPVNACDGGSELNSYERNNRWTKIAWDGADGFVVGWVNSKFLAE